MRNPTQASPFSKTKCVTLKYATIVTSVSTAGAANYQTFRLNDLFDPDVTRSGHQPYYFDQYCTSSGPYTNFRVLGARVVVEAVADTETNIKAMAHVMGPVFTTAAPPHALSDASVMSLLEMPSWTGGYVSPGAPSRKWKFNFTTAKLFGVSPKAVETEEDYEGSASASPSDQWFFTIASQSADAATDTNYTYTVLIEYDVKFQNLSNVVAPS